MAERQGRRIVALVLTHNAPQSLARCLAAIDAQDAGADEVIVVDNASRPPVEAPVLPKSGRSVEVIRSDTNGGPAGGWAIALARFLAGDCTHAWVMDDDMLPDPGCLAALWETARTAPDSAFVFPIAVQPDGSVGRWGSWCGFLISREIVEAVGLPMEALFWWAEDTEYWSGESPRPAFHVGHRRGRGPSRCHPARWRHPDVEVLLRVPQHAVLPPSHQTQGGPLSEEDHRLVPEVASPPEERPDRMCPSRSTRSLRRCARAAGDSLSGELPPRAGAHAVPTVHGDVP